MGHTLALAHNQLWPQGMVTLYRIPSGHIALTVGVWELGQSRAELGSNPTGVCFHSPGSGWLESVRSHGVSVSSQLCLSEDTGESF